MAKEKCWVENQDAARERGELRDEARERETDRGQGALFLIM